MRIISFSHLFLGMADGKEGAGTKSTSSSAAGTGRQARPRLRHRKIIFVVLALFLIVVGSLLCAYELGYFAHRMPAAASATTTGEPSITSFTVNPSSVAVNGTVFINVTAEGFTPPLTYVYQGLPPGCLSANVSSLKCVPTSAGTYSSINVTVTGAHGEIVTSADVTLTVTRGGPATPEVGAPASFLETGDLLILFLLMIALVTVALISALSARRSRLRLMNERPTTQEPLASAPSMPAEDARPTEEDPLDHLL